MEGPHLLLDRLAAVLLEPRDGNPSLRGHVGAGCLLAADRRSKKRRRFSLRDFSAPMSSESSGFDILQLSESVVVALRTDMAARTI